MIVVRLYEGLGNQMFEYSYAYALNKLAEKKNVKVYLDMRDEDVTLYDSMRIKRPLDIKQFNIELPIADEKILRHWNYLVDFERTNIKKKFLIYRIWDYGDIV